MQAGDGPHEALRKVYLVGVGFQLSGDTYAPGVAPAIPPGRAPCDVMCHMQLHTTVVTAVILTFEE